jgi:putative DNA primase/helicase
MHPSTNALIKRLVTSAKTVIRTVSRVITPTPKTMPANCTNINALLMHLCDFDQRTYRYLVKWLAYPLQHPGAKMQYAIHVNGQPGTGSTMFFGMVMAAMYSHSARVLHQNDLSRAFNGWAHAARFALVDTTQPVAKAAISLFVTSPKIELNRKGLEPVQIDNRINFVFLSGSENFLPLSATNRRLFVVEAPPKRERIFYDAVADEIANGGIDAFRDYLTHGVDLVDFNQFSEPPRLAVEAREFA